MRLLGVIEADSRGSVKLSHSFIAGAYSVEFAQDGLRLRQVDYMCPFCGGVGLHKAPNGWRVCTICLERLKRG